MLVLIIKNPKNKIILTTLFSLFWLAIIFTTWFFTSNKISFNVKINNALSFSCPYSMKIEDIYVNSSESESQINAIANLTKPMATYFNSYKSIEGRFSFQYPSFLEIDQQDFVGSDILYHIDLKSSKNEIHGLIQVWNMPYDLKNFLDNSQKQISQNFYNFKSGKINVNGMDGYLWNYSVKSNAGEFKVFEAFLEKNKKMYRISYFIPSNIYKPENKNEFWEIVKSFKVI